MSTDSPYVCTLSAQDVPARTRQIRQLADGLRARHRSPGQVQLRFAGELADVVAEFVRDESSCCSFFEFAVDELEDAVRLTVRAPVEAQPLLDSLHEIVAAPQPVGGHTDGDLIEQPCDPDFSELTPPGRVFECCRPTSATHGRANST